MVLHVQTNSAIRRAQKRLNNEALIKKDLSKIKAQLDSDVSLVIGYNIKTNQFECLPYIIPMYQGINDGQSWNYVLFKTMNPLNITNSDFRDKLLIKLRIHDQIMLSNDLDILYYGIITGKVSFCEFSIDHLVELYFNPQITAYAKQTFKNQTHFNSEFAKAIKARKEL